jgi:hypothetical protein
MLRLFLEEMMTPAVSLVWIHHSQVIAMRTATRVRDLTSSITNSGQDMAIG